MTYYISTAFKQKILAEKFKNSPTHVFIIIIIIIADALTYMQHFNVINGGGGPNLNNYIYCIYTFYKLI